MYNIPDIRPGDAVFARTNTAYGVLIRFGQSLRWWQGRDFNHMAIVVRIDPDGTIWCMQMSRHCEMVKIEDVAPGGGHVWVVPCPPEVDRDKAVAYAMAQQGLNYGIVTIVSIALNIFLPRFLQLDISFAGTLICSALVARAWEHGGWMCPVNPFQITPGQFHQILKSFGVAVYSKLS